MERIFSVAILLGALSGPSAVWAQSYYPQSSVDVIKIGGLFDGDDTVEEAAFKHAVERFNMESAQSGPLRFSAQIERMPKNSYLASPKVCRMMREGVAAIFGPQSDQAASHVQSICDAFEMPHIETKWDYKIRKENYLINLHPHPATLSRAYSDLVDAFHWDSYAIIYEDEDSLYKLQDLIKGIAPPKRQALLRLMPPSLDLRSIYREILRETDITKIVLDCDARKLGSALKQAQQVGLMTYKFSFIITSLDFHTLDLDDFKFAEANITALRLIDPERPELQQVMREWAAMSGPTNEYSSLIHSNSARNNYGGSNNNNGYYQDTSAMFSRYVSGFSYEQSQTVVPMRTDIALIYDAVQLLGKALTTLNQTIDVKSLDCESSDFSRHGYSVINYMKNDLMQGITGWIHFNTTGFRTDVSLDVVQLKEQGITRIGVWDSKFIHKFNWTRPSSPDQPIDEGLMELRNRTLRVTTIMTDPMVMWTRSEVPLAGNARYEGFSVDLLQRLSERIGFKYVIIPVADGKYGKPNANGEWNGMVGEVINGVADVAVADLTINKQRQDAVDFTMPFMNLGISILYVVPSKKPPSLFSFLLPFSKDVWVYMAFAFFGVSLILFILARYFVTSPKNKAVN